MKIKMHILTLEAENKRILELKKNLGLLLPPEDFRLLEGHIRAISQSINAYQLKLMNQVDSHPDNTPQN